MNQKTKSLLYSASLVLLVSVTHPLYAQDLVGELKYRCDSVGGILDEDLDCIDPIIVQGNDDVIPLSDVELPTLQRMALSRLSLDDSELIQTPVDGLDLQPGLTVPGFGTDFSVTQEQGLRMCFNQLEYEVRTCGYAFPRDIQAHNECVLAAGDTYQGCLRWVQTLPYEEFQN